MTSRSDGSSVDISCAKRCKWCDDMSGKGAELSNPSMDRMSLRMSPLSLLSFVPDCSRSNAGILFWPTYLSLTGSDSSRAPRTDGQR